MASLSINDFLHEAQQKPVFDVRSPAEYEYGCIPRALSLPLFTNDERAVVGTIYKQQGKQAAIMKGLEFTGVKLAWYIQQVLQHTQSKQILMYCWRGGMRSQSMAWLLTTYGVEVNTLRGGYKTFRNHVLQKFEQKLNLVVLSGATGSGKTDLLHQLQQQGEQIIDLEQLAQHKGSAFGGVGMPQQPSSEQFENLLAEYMQNLDTDRRIWIEDESKQIGKIHIPNALYAQMRSCKVLRIEIPLEQRVERLVTEYGNYDRMVLSENMAKIEARLGGLATSEALQAIEQGNLHKAVTIALRYYDKAYLHGLSKRAAENILYLPLSAHLLPEQAEQIITFANQQGL